MLNTFDTCCYETEFFTVFLLFFSLLAQQLLEMSHGQCCFKFFTRRIPQKKIVSVIKTHSACLEKAFVIGTATGRRICVSQSVTWAQEAFASMANLQNDDE
uniref:Chemokine interleukin-8-like domain-containing protein n=1 Tax=Pundamilia nyererei TaxID=303518 RepID=A0A3B4FKD9_9CICH